MLGSRLPKIDSLSDNGGDFLPQMMVLPALILVLFALGFGGLALGLSGVSNTILLMSASLVAGALMTFRSLLQRLAEQDTARSIDTTVLSELVEMNRRATVLSDVRGRRIAANTAFQELVGGELLGLGDILGGERSFSAFNKLVNQIRRLGDGEGTFRSTLDHQQDVTLIGRRVGRYILWEVRGEAAELRLKREAAFIEGWAAPFLEAAGFGAAVVDEEGRLCAANTLLREWLHLGPDDALPDRLPLGKDGTYLTLEQGRRIDLDIIRVPLEAREEGNTVGAIFFLRRLASVHSGIRGDVKQRIIDPILDAAPVAVALLDRDGRLVEFNRTLKRYVSEEAIKDKAGITAHLQSDAKPAFFEAVRLAADGTPPVTPLDVTFTQNGERLGQVVFSSFHDDDKRFAVMYLADKTQERQLEQQFVQAQKMQAVGQLAGGVAHDFNNLLTAIIGFCDLLLLRHDTGDRSFSDLIQIKQNANRAANLVRQLLAFSRQQVVKPQILEVSDVLADLSNLVRRLIGEHIDFNLIHGRDLPKIKADQGQFEQVMINLCVNARDAMPDGGDLQIFSQQISADDPVFDEFDVMKSGDYVEIEVRDTGTGIESAVQEKIFEPFFTTKGVGEGTGLGLATVYGIIKQSGGYVFCRSELGKGTSFLLYLPAYKESEADLAPVVEKEEVRDLTGRGTILLVEDEDSVRLFAERALVSKGYKVIECAAPYLALEELETCADDLTLMITDVVMPEMDGPALVDIVRKRRPDLPVIFVSGYAEDLLANKLEDPLNHFMAKPFSLKALAELVKSVMGGKTR